MITDCLEDAEKSVTTENAEETQRTQSTFGLH